MNIRTVTKHIHRHSRVSTHAPRDITSPALDADMKAVFAAQYNKMVSTKVWEGMDFGWITGEDWQKRIATAAQKATTPIANAYGQNAAKKVGIHLIDFIERPNVQAAIREESYHFADAVGDSTKDMLRSTLEEGSRLGESIPSLRDRIKVVMGWDKDMEQYVPAGPGVGEMDNWRAERIARTESAQAITLGEREAYRETGVVTGYWWLAASNCCIFCEALNGTWCELNANFFEKGQDMMVGDSTLEFNYRAVSGPPAHPFCRCALQAEIAL